LFGDDLPPKSAGPEVVEEGRYGPADGGGHMVPAGAAQGNARRYFVTTKKDCDENDADATCVKNVHFAVDLVEVACLSSMKNDDIAHLQQAFNVLLKANMFDNPRLVAPGRNPNQFYCKEYGDQEQVLGRSLQEAFQNRSYKFGAYAPFIGLSQKVTMGEGGRMFQEASAVARYFNREIEYKQSPRAPDVRVPLLDADGRRPNIAGVPVRDLNHPLDEGTLKQVKTAIEDKGTFHVEYRIVKPETVTSKSKSRKFVP
jgi:hypothetical protein